MTDTEHHTKQKQWIRECLIPKLIENGKLFPEETKTIEVKTVEIIEKSCKAATPLNNFTLNYIVSISVIIADDGILQNNVYKQISQQKFDLVVKMNSDVSAEIWKENSLEQSQSSEIIAYEQIIPKIKCLSESPKYYYSHNKFQDAAIVLSNFSSEGWKMTKSTVNLSVDQMFAAVKLLGEFHGSMFGMKLTNADTFNDIKNQLLSPRFVHLNSLAWQTWNELALRRATNSVRTSDYAKQIVPESFLKQLEKITQDVTKYQRRCIQAVEPYAIICHGDYSRTNIAFQYDVDDDDGKAIKAMMFNFQTICYTSPMVDLCTFIANSIGHEMRTKHFRNIFAAYHDSLVRGFLATTAWGGNDIPTFLKYDNLLEEYARYLPFGLTVAATFLVCLNLNVPIALELDAAKIIRRALDEGGESVDEELRFLIIHIYELYEKLTLTIQKIEQ